MSHAAGKVNELPGEQMTAEAHFTLTPLGGEGWEGNIPFNAQMCAREIGWETSRDTGTVYQAS